MSLFYKPRGARLGDTIPFFADGRFHVFYLHRRADDTHDIPETVWAHISTTDFVDFYEHPVALDYGSVTDAGHSIATGSVVAVEEHYQAYYTGFSDWQRDHGGRYQTILRARSDDLETWAKDSEFALVADETRFTAHEWRDPFVFWNPERGCWSMLVVAERLDGPRWRRGVTLAFHSDDLDAWSEPEVLWEPHLFSMHECPDLFRWGDWWYLIYSTLTDRTVTRYRRSRTLAGPWTAPDDDLLDGLGLYAAKSAADGDRRYLFGWVTNGRGGQDDAPWLWGGNLAVHELAQAADGTLQVRMPDVVRHRLGVAPADRLEPIDVSAPHGRADAAIPGVPRAGVLDLAITWSEGTKAFGIEYRVDDVSSGGYEYCWEPALRRVTLDRVGRFGADRAYDIRFFEPPAERSMAVTLFFDGEICVAYVDGRQALTMRGYRGAGLLWNFYVKEGSASVVVRGRADLSAQTAVSPAPGT
uniref:beta-fructofuranosidase n=1 Tax=Arthrobacter globiformis TaxID=1665 RepID=B8R4K7_ARTGO|nr:hypothetical protein [Arthrobacter globiformis]